jgi:hypothetical protein
VPSFNFRRFLPKAQTPTELEDSPPEGGTSPGLFAPLTTESETAPLPVVSVDKRVGLVSEPVGQVLVTNSKRPVEVSRGRSGYVWVSQASRLKRAAWADFARQTF